MTEDVRSHDRLEVPKATLIEVIDRQLGVIDTERDKLSTAYDEKFDEVMAKVKEAVRQGELTNNHPIVQDSTTLRALATFSQWASQRNAILNNDEEALKTTREFYEAGVDEKVMISAYDYSQLSNRPKTLNLDEAWEDAKNGHLY